MICPAQSMFPVGRPVPEHPDEADRAIWAGFSAPPEHYLCGHADFDARCDGCRWFKSTQGRHPPGLDRFSFLEAEERYFVADVRKLPKKTFRGKQYSNLDYLF